MAPDDPSGGRPAAPIVLRIKLRYDDLDAMVQRFAANVGKSGLFLPTRSMQPIGAEVKFELRLADDTAALVGLGRVKAVKPPDPSHPKAAFGMAVELMRVTPQSRALILRMLERRRELGLPEVVLPSAADIDAARRPESDATGRTLETGPIAVVAPPVAADPVAPAAAHAPVGEGLLTAPRRTTGPIAVANVAAIAPLSPEPARRRRTAVSEIIERASGPVVGLAAAAPGLDDEVDVAAAIARARALAGGALDAELEALAEAAAAPREISVEAASAELARQLGGSAVRRDRSGGWALPPPTSAGPPDGAAPGPGDGAGAHAEVDLVRSAEAPAAAAEAPAPVAELPEPAAIAEDHAAVAVPADAGIRAGIDARDDEDDAGVHVQPFGPPEVARIRTEASAPVAVRAQGVERAEIALDDLDSDERTELGEMPAAAGGFALPADADEPGAGDAELAGFAPPAEPPLELGVDEFDDFEIIAEADAGDEDLLAANAEQDASGRRGPARPETGERRPSELDFAARLDLGDDGELDPGAQADELLAGQVIDSLHDELTSQHRAAHRARFTAAPPDPRAISIGAALAALEADGGGDAGFDEIEVTDDPDAYAHRVVRPIFDPDPSSSFTLAGIPSDSIELDAPPPIEPPRPARRHLPLSLHEAPVADDELEHALEALDVDLDDLAIPHAATQLQLDRSRPVPGLRSAPPARAAQPTPPPRVAAATPSRAVRPTGLGAPGSGRLAAPRAPSEGVDVDFDDDD